MPPAFKREEFPTYTKKLQVAITSNTFVFILGNWSEIYLSCSKDEKVFEGLSPSSDYTNGLSHCKIDAREEDCNYIYFQSLEDRPAGKYCHGYNSCEEFRFASLGGQNYYWDDYTRKSTYRSFN